MDHRARHNPPGEWTTSDRNGGIAILDSVTRIGLPSRQTASIRRASGSGSFRLPDLPGCTPTEPTYEAAACGGIQASPEPGPGFGIDPALVQDRHARRRGNALLTALTALQHALLNADGAPPELADLAALLDGPPAASPGLQSVIDSLSLRVRIEIARRSV